MTEDIEDSLPALPDIVDHQGTKTELSKLTVTELVNHVVQLRLYCGLLYMRMDDFIARKEIGDIEFSRLNLLESKIEHVSIALAVQKRHYDELVARLDTAKTTPLE